MVTNVSCEAQTWLMSDRDLWDTYQDYTLYGPVGPSVWCLKEICERVNMLDWLRHEWENKRGVQAVDTVLSVFRQNRLNGSGDEKEG